MPRYMLLSRTTKAIFEKLSSVYIVPGRDARTFVLALELVVDLDTNFGTGKLHSEKIIRIGIEVKISVIVFYFDC